MLLEAVSVADREWQMFDVDGLNVFGRPDSRLIGCWLRVAIGGVYPSRTACVRLACPERAGATRPPEPSGWTFRPLKRRLSPE